MSNHPTFTAFKRKHIKRNTGLREIVSQVVKDFVKSNELYKHLDNDNQKYRVLFGSIEKATKIHLLIEKNEKDGDTPYKTLVDNWGKHPPGNDYQSLGNRDKAVLVFYYFLYFHYDLDDSHEKIFDESHGIDIQDALNLTGDVHIKRRQRAEASSQSKQSKKSSHLSLKPITSNQGFHFSNSEIGVLGRNREEKILDDFLKVKNNFSWLQIAGAGGQGKSRLAHELMIKSAKSGWYSGFLYGKNLDEFEACCDTWKSEKPTLIIIDYVLGNETRIKTVIHSLTDPDKQFSKKVRLLLVERQRWDRGPLKKLEREQTSEKEPQLSPALGGYAEWFVKICDRADGQDKNLHDHAFKDEATETNGVIELKALTPENLIEIIRQIVGKDLFKNYDEKVLEDHLDRIDRSGRPLFAYFLATSIKEEKYQSSWTQSDLLDEAINSNQRKRWQTEFPNATLKLGANTLAARLAVLATMIDGLEVIDLQNMEEYKVEDDEVIRHAVVLNDGHLGASAEVQSLVPPLLPDILGEWFVLRSFANFMAYDLQAIAEKAWLLEPERMAAFLQRIVQDFPNHPETTKLLSVDTLNPKALKSISKVICKIFAELSDSKANIPNQIFNFIEHAAMTEGNTDAKVRLGYCKALGIGFEKSLTEAIPLFEEAVELGDFSAMHNLGFMYYSGEGVKPDYRKAFELFERAAIDGNRDDSMHNLGYCYLEGIGVEIDKAKAIDWYLKAAEAGYVYSMNVVAHHYSTSTEIDDHEEKAFEWHFKAAQLGDADSMFNLANAYYYATGTKKDRTKAARWYLKSAQAGNFKAMDYLAACYHTGDGVELDKAEGIKWRRKAAIGGEINAMNAMATCYQNGDGLDKNLEKAFEWFLKAAELNDGFAMNNVAIYYNKGEGIPRDLTKAFKWYLAAAESGYLDAMRNIAICYQRGEGVEQDKTKAFEWRLAAAQHENVDDMYLVAASYHQGSGVKQNPHKAFEWFLKTAEGGHLEAMRVLGNYFYEGLSGEKNYTEAFIWFLKSSEGGNILSMRNVAYCYYTGLGVEESKIKSFEWSLKAAKLGNVDVMYAVADCYERGDGVEKNQAKATYWYRRSKELGEKDE